MRLSVSRAVAVETTRGWRIAKEKTSHKIDVVVALGMAALGAVSKGEIQQQKVPIVGAMFWTESQGWSAPIPPPDPPRKPSTPAAPTAEDFAEFGIALDDPDRFSKFRMKRANRAQQESAAANCDNRPRDPGSMWAREQAHHGGGRFREIGGPTPHVIISDWSNRN